MQEINQDELWFNTPDSHTLCRGGGNGPDHPSQLYAIRKYVTDDTLSFLDYGSGSGTTLEAMLKADIKNVFKYRGLDVIEKNIAWCKDQFKGFDFKYNSTLHKIDELNKSWGVVYSRHVVDHMRSFEDAVDEHCRVAKKYVIIVLWVPFSDDDDHQIKNIVENGKTYSNEYTNKYSRKKVIQKLHEKIHDGWKLCEITENVGSEVRGNDTVIVLERVR